MVTPWPFRVGDRLHVGDLLADARQRRRPHRLHEPEGPRRVARHAVGELPGGVVGMSEQPHPLVPEPQDLGDDGVVVVLVAVVAARDEGAPHLFTEGALGRVGQEGIDRGAGVGDGVLVRVVALGGGRRGGLDVRVGQAAQLILRDIGDDSFLVGEDVVREAGVEFREPLVDRRVAVLRRALEGGAVAGEAVVDQPDEALLVGPQGALLRTRLDRPDAREERLVLRDLRAKLGELRGHLLLDGAELGAGAVRGPDAPVGEDPIEIAAGALEGLDGVLEGRGLGVGGDGVDLFEVTRHAGLESGAHDAEVHPVEGRHAAVRSGPVREQDVALHGRSLRDGTDGWGLFRTPDDAGQGGQAGDQGNGNAHGVDPPAPESSKKDLPFLPGAVSSVGRAPAF